MPLLRRGDMQITVPDAVVDDYRADGWRLPGEDRSPEPDNTWTVDELRKLVAQRRVPYRGLHKDELLEALK